MKIASLVLTTRLQVLRYNITFPASSEASRG